MLRFLPLLLIFLSPSIGSSQDIPTTQTPLVTKVTATWCSSCGSWGWTFFHDVIDDNPSNAIYMAAHPSGDLVSPEGQEFTSNFGANGQPRFYLNNNLISVNAGSIGTVSGTVATDIMNMTNQSASVGTGIEVTRDGDTFTANTTTQFFDATEGEYHLGIYVIENHVIANQQSQGPNADHAFVLRTSFGGNTFGNAIATGMIEAGHEVTNTLTTDLNPGWNAENLLFAAIVWKKVDGTFEYVNGNQVQETVVSSSNEVDFSAFGMEWITNEGNVMLSLDADKDYQDLQIAVYSVDGKLVFTEVIELLNEGRHQRTLPLASLPAGSYAVQISGKNLRKSILLVK